MYSKIFTAIIMCEVTYGLISGIKIILKNELRKNMKIYLAASPLHNKKQLPIFPFSSDTEVLRCYVTCTESPTHSWLYTLMAEFHLW